MYYIDKLKETITKASEELIAAFLNIDSPDFEAGCMADIYPKKLGYLSGAVRIHVAASIGHAARLVEQASPDIAWGERCAALCESLDIDDTNIAELETLASNQRYKGEARDVRTLIANQAIGVRDDARELEYEEASKALTEAGFIPASEDEVYTRGNQQIGVGRGSARGKGFWYTFVLEVDGIETLRGKSGEFAGLLAAVGIVQPAVEVKK